MGGGGGSSKTPAPVYYEEPVVMPEQRSATAQPVMNLMSEVESRNKKFAAALLTQDWLKPPTLGIPSMGRKDTLGL
jgi:hypothetical protein